MKKRAFTAVLLSTMLILALAGTMLVNVSVANPYSPGNMMNKAIVRIYLPENKIYDPNNVPNVPISFTVESLYPGEWEITSVYGIKIYLDGDSCENAIAIEPTGWTNYRYSYSSTLAGLALGPHSIYVVAYVSYETSIPGWWPGDGTGASNVVYFTVATPPPIIRILSINQQQTFNVTAVPLDFSVSKPVSWMGYSLDGQSNVTITGNTTLAGLSEGTHSLFVYANDSFGQTAKSLIRYFTIAEPPPSFPTTLTAAIVVFSAVAVVVAVLFYFKKRKR